MVPMNERYAVVVEIFLDGNQWGALVGENITVGVPCRRKRPKNL